MRVLTPFGFGEVSSLPLTLPPDEKVLVHLEKPFLGSRVMMLERRSISTFTDWGVVKVLNVAGILYFSGGVTIHTARGAEKLVLRNSAFVSTVQFFDSPEEACLSFSAPAQQNETRVLVNLTSREVEINQELGPVAKNCIFLRPWLDRWGPEHSEFFTSGREAREKFTKEMEDLAGAEGIATGILVDSRAKCLLGFYIAVKPSKELGVIFSIKP